MVAVGGFCRGSNPPFATGSVPPRPSQRELPVSLTLQQARKPPTRREFRGPELYHSRNAAAEEILRNFFPANASYMTGNRIWSTVRDAKMAAIAPKEAVRDAILDATNRLLARFGYRKMTVEDIAAEAGIGKGTVYLHFSSKEEVVLSHVDRVVDRLKERLREISGSDLSCLLYTSPSPRDS